MSQSTRPPSAPQPHPPDAAAFDALVRRYWAPVLSVARRRLGDHHAAEDVVQEVFLKAWKHRAALARRDDPLPWLFKAAHWSAMERYRAAGLRAFTGLTDDYPVPSREPDPAALAVQAEVVAAVRAAVERLKPRHRAALAAALDGGGLAAAAAALGSGADAARMMAKRARAELAGVLVTPPPRPAPPAPPPPPPRAEPPAPEPPPAKRRRATGHKLQSVLIGGVRFSTPLRRS